MRVRRAVPLAALTLVLLTACAAGEATDREVAGGALSNAPEGRLSAMAAMDGRVVEVFHRLVTANVDLCPDKGWAAGWSLHAANQYVGDLRDVLLAEGDMQGDLPAVSAVAPGGGADRAGLSRGDVILRVQDTLLQVGSSTGRARYEGVAANLATLNGALATGQQLSLTVRRAGVERQVTVTPDRACAYAVHLDVSDQMNARADGRGVFISSALVAYAASADDLAVVLGHELAHNVLEHREILDRESPARRVFGNFAVAPGRLEAAERDADRLGLFLMARADFAFDTAPAFWRRFGADNWRARWAQWGHPSAGARATQLDLVVTEIQGLRAAGRELVP